MALDDVISDLLVKIAKNLNQRPSDGRGGELVVHRDYIVGVGNRSLLPGVSSDSNAAASDSSPRR